MAKASKPKSKSTKTSGAKSVAKSKSQSAASAKKHSSSIILMAIAVLFLCLVIIKAGSLWGIIHNFLHGLFGVVAYIIPFILGYIAVLIALDKPMKSVSVKVWQSVFLTIVLCSTLQIFMFNIEGINLIDSIKTSYLAGISHRGGGFFGVVPIGYLLEYLLTDIGAKIIIILLAVVFLLLVTGTSLITLARWLAFPFKKAKESIDDVIENGQFEREKREKAKIDIDLEGELKNEDLPLGDRPPSSEKLEKFKKLASALNEEEPIGEKSKIDIPLNGGNSPDAENSSSLEDKPLEAPAINKTAENQEGGKTDIAATIQKAASAGERDKNYSYPPLSLLDEPKVSNDTASELDQNATAELLVKTLQDFGISTKVVNISSGPSVTRYELEPSAGVKISRITSLADDIALRLATTGVRIEAPIPNKAAVGIEVPNRDRRSVCLSEMIGSKEFSKRKSKLTVSLGKDISGEVVYADLSAMPHLLIAGTTGSGKSVCTNAMIQSVLYKASPSEVRMLLIDPKQVEFGVYNDIPHLLVPVVTDPRKAAGALGWAVSEMLERYKLFAANNVRDINSYNELAAKSETLEKKPLILIVIDELADLMMAAANEVEDAIIRLAQMARAAGMHLVIATQRPSVDVITGLIKANIPSRLALTVASAVDSRTILDGGGAEKLLGRGDMLFMPIGVSKPMRVQGCFVSNKEVESVVAYLKHKEKQEYDETVIEEINRQAEAASKSAKDSSSAESEETDELYMQAIEAVVEAGQASTSMLQRRLRVGYARAGRLIDEMEQRGIIGPHEGSKPREVLLSRQQFLEMSLNQAPASSDEPSGQVALADVAESSDNVEME